MDTKERIKEELKNLVEEGHALSGMLSAKTADKDAEFIVNYQLWYTKAIKLARLLAPDRYEEFCAYYEPDQRRKQINVESYRIQDFFRGIRPVKNPSTQEEAWDARAIANACVLSQSLIAESLVSRIDGIIAELESAIAYGIQDAEIDSAESLKKVNLRASGAIAGVVLETHLQRVATAHAVTISKKDPSIGDLNEPLKKAGVYDISVYRKIQLLADIRNICTHQKGKDPTPDQIDDMLNGIRSIVKSVF
jgi:hypothetical protein